MTMFIRRLLAPRHAASKAAAGAFVTFRRSPSALALCAAAAAAAAALSAPPAQAQQATEEHAEEDAGRIVVQGTRTRRRVGDEPIRVEVLNREEIEEKILMRPGNIATLLSETGGLRVQVTSPALGAANIRVQGLAGRYTQLLADGLPLYGQASSLGLLQIPPTDLGQVEVIKGAASALYGAQALGGVINLVSRRPGATPEAELLLNATTRDGQDATAYLAGPLGAAWSGSVTAGLHGQSRQDLDGDSWSDLAAYERWTIRPRLFWEGTSGAEAFVTLGAMGENRRGGTEPGGAAPDGNPFPQTQRTGRLDAGLVASMPVGDAVTANLRASGMRQEHDHLYGDVAEDDRHETMFVEAALSGETGATAWVAGAALQRDAYRNGAFPAFDYVYTAPGVFAQAEYAVRGDLTLAASARADAHSDYGDHFSPRLSALYRPGPWTVRASYGGGFTAPTPFVDEIEAAGLSRLAPLRGLRAEIGETASLDVGYARGPFEANVTLFASDLDHSTRLETIAPDRVRLVNVAGSVRTQGAELLLRYRIGDFTMTGSYVFVDASEPDPSGFGRRTTPLTPRHSAGFVAVWEEPGVGRVGFEAYYTGRQALDDNPYRTGSRPYLELGMLAEMVVGGARLFVNAENILDVRQTDYDPLLRPARAPDGRWTVDAWAPADGFIVNAGVRLQFGG